MSGWVSFGVPRRVRALPPFLIFTLDILRRGGGGGGVVIRFLCLTGTLRTSTQYAIYPLNTFIMKHSLLFNCDYVFCETVDIRML